MYILLTKLLLQILKIASLGVVIVSVPIALWEGYRFLPSANAEPAMKLPTYAEAVAIILTAVTIVLAFLAIIVAALAVWGYQSIKSEASAVADRAVEKAIQPALAKYVAEHEKVLTAMAKKVRRKTQKEIAQDVALLYSGAFEATGLEEEETGETSRVGKPYPGDETHEG